jgi:heat-inducible transcriptional repressor
MGRLENRSEQILKAIVSEYVATGEPVGSRTLSKKGEIGLSAASIRNIMSDLTDSGFITQPHVSAGRVPTDLGYRFYVDVLLRPERLDTEEEAMIETLLGNAGLDIRDVLRKSSGVLAGFSRQAGVVASPPADHTFKSIDFIKVAEDKILVVLVSTAGTIHNKIIFDEDGIKQETLERYSRMLCDMLKDLDLREARERIESELNLERTRVDAMLAKVLRLGHSILMVSSTREVFIEGQINILEDPEFAHIEKLRAVLVAFEEKSNFLKILDKTLEARGIQILIGSEHGVGELDTCSIVAYPIRTKESCLGSIAVVGPKRMDYQKVVPVVSATARIITKIVKRIVENDV